MTDNRAQLIDALFYDDDCRLCRARAERLRRLQDGGLELIPLGSIDSREDTPGLLIMKRSLHLKTGGGDWLTGLDAALRAWSHTRRGAWLTFLGWPVVRIPAVLLYDWLELRRYRRLYGCSDCDAQ